MTVGGPFSVSGSDFQDVIPVDVRVVDDATKTESVAPDFGAANTIQLQLAGASQPVQVLTRRVGRSKARILVASLGGIASNTPSQEFYGTVNTPGAGTTIVTSGTLPAGNYQVVVQSLFTGTVTFADANNIGLYVGAIEQGVIMQQGSAEFLNTSPTYTVTVPVGGAPILVKTIGAGSGTAQYYNSITITPVGGTGGASSAIFHARPEVLTNPNIPATVGFQVTTTPFLFDWESQAPLYGVGIGGLVTVSVIDESFEEVPSK
jgi:hypothetical protein